MIEFIKEYGVTNLDFEYIMHNLKLDVIEMMCLSESNVRKNLAFYNELGITSNIAKIIMSRPDLIIIEPASLKKMVGNIDKELFVNVVDKSIEDLILVGV